MSLLPNEIPEGTGLGAAIASIIGAAMWFRVKWSKDKVELVTDDARNALMLNLQAERDKYLKAAEEAWKSKTEDAIRIAQLTTEVKHLTESNQLLVASNQHLIESNALLVNKVESMTERMKRMEEKMDRRRGTPQ